MPVHRVLVGEGAAVLEQRLLQIEAAGEEVLSVVHSNDGGHPEHVIVTRAAKKQTRPATR